MVFSENTGARLHRHQKSVLLRIGAVGAMRQRNLEAGIEGELGIATWNMI